MISDLFIQKVYYCCCVCVCVVCVCVCIDGPVKYTRCETVFNKLHGSSEGRKIALVPENSLLSLRLKCILNLSQKGFLKSGRALAISLVMQICFINNDNTNNKRASYKQSLSRSNFLNNSIYFNFRCAGTKYELSCNGKCRIKMKLW